MGRRRVCSTGGGGWVSSKASQVAQMLLITGNFGMRSMGSIFQPTARFFHRPTVHFTATASWARRCTATANSVNANVHFEPTRSTSSATMIPKVLWVLLLALSLHHVHASPVRKPPARAVAAAAAAAAVGDMLGHALCSF